MDLKETDILGSSIDQHWYYASKAAATKRLLGDTPIKKFSMSVPAPGFYPPPAEPYCRERSLVRGHQLRRGFGRHHLR